MTIFDLLTLIFGISLLLFGINLMGETLKKSAGRKLKLLLGRLTSNPIKGFLLGALITAIIQSSSATTVMVVGFVNSGTMLLSQAIGVVMGANVGTSLTSWITALAGMENIGAVTSIMQWFKPSTFTPVIAIVGLLLYLSDRSDKKKSIGLILLGFSILMIGMETMSEAVEGLSQNEAFKSILLLFENPILGLLAGLVITAIIQSSSASIGILQSFTSTGAITFGAAVPIIMGQNIGTCVTALIASTSTNKNAKRTSIIHLLFNVFGAVIGLVLFYLIKYLLRWTILDGPIDVWGIATVHTLFNIVTVIVLFPLSKKLEKIAIAWIKDNGAPEKASILDEHLLEIPSIAIKKSNELATEMGISAMESVTISCQILNDFSEKKIREVRKKEVFADECEDKLGTYLLKISKKSILDSESQEINKLLHIIGDFERISDHARNITESAEEMNDKKIIFSSQVKHELSVLTNAITEITSLSIECITDNDYKKAIMVEPLEQVIDQLCDEIKRRHIIRLQNNDCTIEQGFILTDIITNLERIADHCSNIAVCFIEISKYNTMNVHRYLNDYRKNQDEFDYRYKMYFEKYNLNN